MSNIILPGAPDEAPPQQLLPPDTREWTEKYRLGERAKARASLLYFQVGICGLIPTGPRGESQLSKYHADQCSFLEGRDPHHPWLRAMMCCFRGGSKSVSARVYTLWRCLEIVNLSAYLVSNSDDNAKKLHFEKIVHLLDNSERSEYIRWIYKDRIPPNLVGTNKERLELVKTDTQADPAFTYGGISTSRRGKHPDIVLADDLEGADDPKSGVQSEDAYAAYQSLIPLMRHLGHSQILVVATPTEGDDFSLVWRLREKSSKEVLDATGHPWNGDEDNEHCSLKIFWRPIVDANGKSAWPERFPKREIDQLLTEPIAKTQYLLKRATSGLSIFDMAAITKGFYRFTEGSRDSISYRGFRFDRDRVTDEGYVLPEPSNAVVKLKALRYFLHFDPLHKSKSQRKSAMRHQRPAKAAAVVVGVAPDSHAFVLDYWIGSEEIGEQASQVFRLYRKWQPHVVTSEAIGAQVWFKAFIESREMGDPNWSRPMSAGFLSPSIAMPRLSSRLQEAEKGIESKEAIFRESLSPWFNVGSLHIREDQRELVSQLQEAANEEHEIDLVDALAQGTSVWKPPTGDPLAREWAERRAFHEAFKQQKGGSTLSRTGFKSSGWSST
jgi:hypothetical protein